MAEFCSVCAPKYGFKADIDISRIFAQLRPGEGVPVLCEGCELVRIEKTAAGVLNLVYRDSKTAVKQP